MPDTTPTPALKRSRALPRVWERFVYLNLHAPFFISRCAYMKSGFFRAVTLDGSRFISVPPWRRVQTPKLVRDARPGGKSSPPPFTVGPVVVDIDAPVNDGRTHFVDDDCKGGHADVSQPHSDNGISGPTS